MGDSQQRKIFQRKKYDNLRNSPRTIFTFAEEKDFKKSIICPISRSYSNIPNVKISIETFHSKSHQSKFF